MRTIFAWALVLLCLLIPFAQTLSAASVPGGVAPALLPPALETVGRSVDREKDKVAPEVRQALRTAAAGDKIPIIVTMKKQADLSGIGDVDRDERVRRVVQTLQDTSKAGQVPIQAFLATQRARGLAGPPTRFWVFNGLAVSAKAVVIDQLAARKDVARISPNQTFQAPALEAGETTVEPNLFAIQAPALWDQGYRGQGIVVANVDTGVSLHPDLSAQWRGGSNSWFDPYNEHPDTPADLSGHGTQTMGVMVGRDLGGTAIGVAPDAQWIAAKIFNDQGQATTTGIHAAYQWLLDPDGNPQTADAPHVVNSSWSFDSSGCDLEFQLDLQALRAANILPVFSAGNFGPNGATSASPANYPEAFAVGAIDDLDQIYTLSSLGPSDCGEVQTVFPEMVAPGVAIRTTERYGLYTDATGTSAAAPHAAGALALLLSAYPQLTAAQQESALLAGAFDLGPAGPDNDFGSGRLDVWASYQVLLSGGPPPTPTPTPTPTATPDPSVNLALNRPVTVSSTKDDAHSGDKAVDGSLDTYWQTAKAVGKKVLPSEWIAVDLGSSTTVGAVSLVWDDNYATRYSIEVSDDGNTWTSVYNTTSGDGGADAITFAAVTARHVRMDSTAWTSTSQRVWLQEFEVYAAGGSPPPTQSPTPISTPTPPATATPPPTATPTPESTITVHIGDLDGSSAPVRTRWNAALSVLVHDELEDPVAGANVSGSWSDGVTGEGSCTTDTSGRCDIVKAKLKDSVASVTFTITDIASSSGTYEPAGNHDPDGDSDGTTITIAKP